MYPATSFITNMHETAQHVGTYTTLSTVFHEPVGLRVAFGYTAATELFLISQA